MVETHLTLREADRVLVDGLEFDKRGQRVSVEAEQVAERDVVVVDRVALLEAEERRVLSFHSWQQRLALHDVVKRGQRQHRQGAIFVDAHASDGLNISLQHT